MANKQQWFDKWCDKFLPFLVLITSASCAAILLKRFLNHPRLLWSNVIHDRNAHLLSGMNLASHLQHGAWSQVFADLDSFRTWPPLHDGLCVGLSVGFGHADERWAILSSLLAWVGSAVFAYLLAHAASPRGNRIAGLLAALLVLVSPAHRAYATDVMLESLGACLTLACLHAYIVARKTDSPNAYRTLAIALTLLFLEKYNYWSLAVLGLLVDWMSSEPSRGLFRLKEHLQTLKEWLHSSNGRTWLVRQARHPLNYLLGALIALIATIILAPWNSTTLFGRHILLQPPANLITLAYVVLLIRLALWYRHACRAWIALSSHRVRALLTWHVWPVGIWFLGPHHLYSFLWVNSPAANGGEFPRHDLLGGYPFYGNCLCHDYHISAWSALAVIGLFLAGCWAAVRGRLCPGAAAIFWLVIIAFFLTVHHPNRKSRFLHTWVPVVWVGAGIGVGSLMPESGRKRNGMAAVCCFGGLGLLSIAHFPGLWATAHAPEGGLSSSHHSALDLTDAYLPDLADSRYVAMFSNMPMKQFAQWTYLKQYPRRKRLETDVKGFNPLAADNSACFDTWLSRTECDTVVYLDFAPESVFYQSVPNCENLGQYGDMLQKQTLFTAAARHVLPPCGCTVTVWKRKRSGQR